LVKTGATKTFMHSSDDAIVDLTSNELIICESMSVTFDAIPAIVP
jgi:hypothetical protein